MQEKISALMDGELDADDASAVIEQFKNAEELRERWVAYHLISDASYSSRNVADDPSYEDSSDYDSDGFFLDQGPNDNGRRVRRQDQDIVVFQGD